MVLLEKGENMFAKVLGLTSVAVAATAVIGSIASQDVQSRWYKRLDKPAIQPPAVVFPIVWTTLYADIAVSSAVVLDRLRRNDPEAARSYQRALAINLMLNASWCWVFFKAHRPAPAVVVAAALAGSSTDLVCRAGAVRSGAGLALLPYAAWCGFATVLTAAIWRRNRG